VWDRASWYASTETTTSDDDALQHIAIMLRWLWARSLTTPLGDQAAQGEFSGTLGTEVALTSEMVTEAAAVFLDHYYGPWLNSLPERGDGAFDDDAIDALWADYESRSAELSRVWGV
jgi:hypothetical protein